jgi:hypothetical protein
MLKQQWKKAAGFEKTVVCVTNSFKEEKENKL